MPETSIYRVVDLTGTPEQVASSTWLLSGFPNIIFVVGDNGILVVDTGLGDRNGALVARLAQQLSRGSKFFVTTTHFHPEHAAGIGGFPSAAVLIRPRVQQDEMDEMGEAVLASFRESPALRRPWARPGRRARPMWYSGAKRSSTSAASMCGSCIWVPVTRSATS